jgi:hypothetical protein
MNNPTRHRPALSCRLVRRWESSHGTATDLTWVAERHCERCDACAEFFTDDAAFEQSLRREARGIRVEPSAGFEQRILRAVRESQPEPEPARVRPLSIAFAGVAAGVALAIVVAQQMGVKDDGAAPRVATHETPATANPANSSESAAAGWWSSLREVSPVRTLAEKNPLQEEIDYIYTDAQSVLGFLALNFLPSTDEHPANAPKETGAARQG